MIYRIRNLNQNLKKWPALPVVSILHIKTMKMLFQPFSNKFIFIAVFFIFIAGHLIK
ncbi:hypothetical protein Hore_10700 [Halothermothrix orenii H 168]|uniref:Uncharacterized protein n=1 Tax=Halothermothrix orenii (strain H 168 / OCM 544 / DSM 9562) TaxID=373903 RepID=B8CX06_HALOH|nr:hypothetical protein Hore_10700 [Halothermothrix orenii H 168]